MQMAHLTHDHRYMPQIVSSAMWNCPPPSKLITLLERTNRASRVTHHTQEKMVSAFQVRPFPTSGRTLRPCLIHALADRSPAPPKSQVMPWKCSHRVMP